MEKLVTLKDGTEVLIREMRPDDAGRSLAFFQALPDEDTIYLRRPMRDSDAVQWRIQTMKSGAVLRLVALAGDEIVADGALELEGHGWKEDVGEMRLIVAHAYQGKGLGKRMAFELYKLANKRQIDEIVVKMMGPQTGVRRMFEHLGFHPEAELHDYVKDLTGHKQDLILMRCKLRELWDKMEDQVGNDWRRMR